MKKIQITTENFSRLDVCVAQLFDVTRNHAQKLIEQGCVEIDGKVVTKLSKNVAQDSQVSCDVPEAVPLELTAQDIPLDIVYQDEWLAVINKARGMTVHPANNVFRDTLVNALLHALDNLSGINGVMRPGIVHRLDKDTTGLLVVAKNDVAHASLAKQIQTKTCKRIYWALVEGVVKQDNGVVDLPIGRDKKDRKKMAITPDGRSAVTLWQVVARFQEHTLVQFELKTGRTHQIRVHAKSLGHPVVGDAKYGYKKQKFNLDGQLLHARQISFCHPNMGENMTFEAPLPQDFQNILDKLSK